MTLQRTLIITAGWTVAAGLVLGTLLTSSLSSSEGSVPESVARTLRGGQPSPRFVCTPLVPFRCFTIGEDCPASDVYRAFGLGKDDPEPTPTRVDTQTAENCGNLHPDDPDASCNGYPEDGGTCGT